MLMAPSFRPPDCIATGLAISWFMAEPGETVDQKKRATNAGQCTETAVGVALGKRRGLWGLPCARRSRWGHRSRWQQGNILPQKYFARNKARTGGLDCGPDYGTPKIGAVVCGSIFKHGAASGLHQSLADLAGTIRSVRLTRLDNQISDPDPECRAKNHVCSPVLFT